MRRHERREDLEQPAAVEATALASTTTSSTARDSPPAASGWSTLLVELLPAIEHAASGEPDDPFHGSVIDELWAMGAEAATETRRMAGVGVAAARGRLSLRR